MTKMPVDITNLIIRFAVCSLAFIYWHVKMCALSATTFEFWYLWYLSDMNSYKMSKLLHNDKSQWGPYCLSSKKGIKVDYTTPVI